MRLLLDTHAWLWMAADESRIGERARQILRDPDTELFLSAASVWEIAIKHTVGKVRYVGNPEVLIPQHIRRTGVAPLYITVDHVLAAAALPMHHRDPFDRMIVAQARTHELMVATADRKMALYEVETLDPRL